MSVYPEPLGIEDDRRSTKRGQRRLDLPDLILVCRVMKVEPRELLGDWISNGRRGECYYYATAR